MYMNTISSLQTTVSHLALLQRNWDSENSKLLRSYQSSLDQWTLEKSRFLSQLTAVQQSAADERICFVNELEKLIAEKVSLQKEVEVAATERRMQAELIVQLETSLAASEGLVSEQMALIKKLQEKDVS